MIVANTKSIESANESHRPVLQVLSKNIGTLLSSYTKAINKTKHRRGSLFSHNTKAVMLNSDGNHLENCFFYIHQNPLLSGLVQKIENWEFSSFNDYAGIRKGTLCNKELAEKLVAFDTENFHAQSYAIIDEKVIEMINYQDLGTQVLSICVAYKRNAKHWD